MARKAPRPAPSIAQHVSALRADCPDCGRLTRAADSSRRTIAALEAVTRLNLSARRCRIPDCPAHLRPCRPEAEGRLGLPHPEFGLDVVALVGRLRYPEHRSVPEIHRH